jgi:hypothetical protein
MQASLSRVSGRTRTPSSHVRKSNSPHRQHKTLGSAKLPYPCRRIVANAPCNNVLSRSEGKHLLNIGPPLNLFNRNKRCHLRSRFKSSAARLSHRKRRSFLARRNQSSNNARWHPLQRSRHVRQNKSVLRKLDPSPRRRSAKRAELQYSRSNSKSRLFQANSQQRVQLPHA